MIGLLFELFAWMIKIAIVVCVLMVKATVWTYHALDEAIHAHRLSKDPQASREGSQLMAGTAVAAIFGVLVLIGSLTGGGSSSGGPTGAPATAEAAVVSAHTAAHTSRPNEARQRAARKRARARARLRARHAAARRAERASARRRRAVARVSSVSNCNSNYGGCLTAAGDYDCEGGSGDGPNYTGVVEVKGYDEYDLDRDDDGYACN